MSKHKRTILYVLLVVLTISLFVMLYIANYPSTDPQLPTSIETVANRQAPDVTELWQDTNSERQKAGTTPLVLDTKLDTSAATKCQALLQANIFEHNMPDGRTPEAFIHDQVGSTYSYWSENLAEGYATSQAVVDAWMHSESHRTALLDPKFDNVGFGTCHSPRYGYIVVQHFIDVAM